MRPAWRTNDVAALREAQHKAVMQASITLGRSPRAVQCMARRLDIKLAPIPHGRYWPCSTRRRAMRLRGEGFTVSAISRSLGVPFGTVRRWVYADGVRLD